MASNDITISAEKLALDAMRHVAKTMWDEHQICIHQVNFNWLDVTTTSEQGKILTTAELRVTPET